MRRVDQSEGLSHTRERREKETRSTEVLFLYKGLRYEPGNDLAHQQPA